FDGNSGGTVDVTFGANATCKSFRLGGPYVTLDLQGTYAISVAGDVTLFRVTIVDPAASGVFVVTADCTFRTYGYDACSVVIAGGTTTLADALWCSASLVCSSFGVFDTAGYAVTVGQFRSTSADASTVLNGSLVTVTGAGVAWDFVAGALSAGTSTIKFTNASAADRSFKGGGKTYWDVWFSGAYAGILGIDGSNTFNDLKSDGGLHVIEFSDGSTQSVATLTLGGTGGGARTTLRSQTSGVAWNLTCPDGEVDCEWLILKDSHASGGATFTATNSSDAGGNSGWSIVAPFVLPAGDRRVRLTYIRR
ncbi:MAG: hypothetical protein AB7U95_30010, partial [Reyranella sp.]